jgi:hypothetical protein
VRPESMPQLGNARALLKAEIAAHAHKEHRLA